MPVGESKIKFTVEGITQLHQSFQSILNDSRALTEEWSKQGTTIIQSLQEQIELLKKRNSVAFPSTGFASTGTPGGGSGRDDIRRSGDIENALESIASEGVLIHKESLKELADLLKVASPSATPGEPQERGSSNRQPTNDREDEKDDRRNQFLKSLALSTLINPIKSNDPVSAGIGLAENAGFSLMAMGGKAGLVGLFLSAAAAWIGAEYKAVANIAPTAARASRIWGNDWAENVVGWNGKKEAADYGLTRNEVLERQMAISKAMGIRDKATVNRVTDEAMLWESTTPLESSDIAAYAKSRRGSSGSSISRELEGFFGSLQKQGISRDKIFSQMNEYLSQLVSLNQAQLAEWGGADTTLSTALYSMVSKALPEATKNNPELAGRLASSIYSGMSTASSRQIEALQYSVASRVMGSEGTWYTARVMREDPFGLQKGISKEESARRQEYGQELLKSYRSAAGSQEGFAYLLEKQFGIKANQAWAFAQQYDRGDFDIAKFRKEAGEAKSSTEIEEGLRKTLPQTVDTISKTIAAWEMVKVRDNIDTIKRKTETIVEILTGKDGPILTAVGKVIEALGRSYQQSSTYTGSDGKPHFVPYSPLR
jgi:hypothetical protein